MDFQSVSKALKRLSLSNVSLDGMVVRADTSSSGSGGGSTLKTTAFPLMLISTLNNLTRLSLNGWALNADDAVDIGKAIRDKSSSTVLELSLKQIASPTARIIIRTAEDGDRVTAAHAGFCIYRFKKTGRRSSSFLNRMMCLTSSWQE